MLYVAKTSRPPDRALADAIRELRAERNLTQQDLAMKAGLTLGAIARIETYRVNPTWLTVRDIAAALDVSMVELAERLGRRAEP
jgi:transcriptional regulator with XRE-family HTH domain